MISVDGVYKAVLLILNKEQRGYLTPDQFNKIAKQVQLELLEKTFFSYNKELLNKKKGVINSDYGDLAKIEKEKIDIFAKTDNNINSSGGDANLPSDLYRIVNLTVKDTYTQIEEVTKSDWNYIMASPLTTPTIKYPIYYRQDNVINVFPITVPYISLDYIRKPLDPVWAYSVDATTSMYIYEPTATGSGVIPSSGSVDFELHPSEEVDLIINILAYAGVAIKDATVAQAAIAERTYNNSKEQ
jgi:hypothetical protein